MALSNVRYINNYYPFLESDLWNGRMMTRADAKQLLIDNGLEVPERSACYFCPFHSKAEWRNIRDSEDGDWERAIEFDYGLRKLRPPYDLFVCDQRVPLDKADLRTLEDHGQMKLDIHGDALRGNRSGHEVRRRQGRGVDCNREARTG